MLIQPFQHPDLVLIMQEKPAMTPLTKFSISLELFSELYGFSKHPEANEVRNSEEPPDEAVLRASVARLSYFSMWTPSGVVGWL